MFLFCFLHQQDTSFLRTFLFPRPRKSFPSGDIRSADKYDFRPAFLCKKGLVFIELFPKRTDSAKRRKRKNPLVFLAIKSMKTLFSALDESDEKRQKQPFSVSVRRPRIPHRQKFAKQKTNLSKATRNHIFEWIAGAEYEKHPAFPNGLFQKY